MHIAFVRCLLVICLIYMQNATATHVTDDVFLQIHPIYSTRGTWTDIFATLAISSLLGLWGGLTEEYSF